MPDPSPPTAAADLLGNTTAPPTAAGTPTAEESLLGPEKLPPPQGGAANDVLWSHGALGRIMDHIGASSGEFWSADPPDLSPAAIAGARKIGLFNKGDGTDTYIRAGNEAIIRPMFSLGVRALQAIPAAIAGIGGAVSQIGEEIKGESPTPLREAVAAPFSAVGEIGEHPEAFGDTESLGAIGEAPAAVGGLRYGGRATAEAKAATTAAEARSVGAVGEGEAGYYDAEPITPEAAQARTEAAQEAGVEPIAPQPPPPDVHALARRIDPETFEQYDALSAERDLHRNTIAGLTEARDTSPEVQVAQGDVDTILSKVNGVEARLTNAAAGRLETARGRLDALLTADSPEMAEARAKMMDADFAMRELAPDVSEAYRQAREIAPNIPEVAEAELGATMLPGEQETEPLQSGAPNAIPAVAAEEGTVSGAPPNVVGDQRLGAVAEPAAQGAATAEGAPATEATTNAKPPTAKYGNLRAIEGTGETATRGLSEGVEAKAIEDGLTSTFGNLPEYDRVNMKDQAAKVAELINADYETAKEIAMGDRQPPKNVLPESVFVGVEKHALATGDVETLRQLATRSRLNTTATTMGQRIRTLGERDQASPVGMILDVQKAREADFAKRGDIAAAKRETVAEIKEEVRNAASKPAAWDAFISSITCGE